MAKKTQYCEQNEVPLACHRSAIGKGSCGEEFDGCRFARKIKDAKNGQ